ncbi:hypothetical protein [Xanthomonas euvesicatoria]|uniref:hypothetical protein n=1 Tax=Xanthomonas euvesicatoria TaxID=456327 RepID=UPI0035566C98
MLRNDERWVIFMEANVDFVPGKAPNVMKVDEFATLVMRVPGTSLAEHKADPLKGDELITLDRAVLYPADNPKALVLLFSFTNAAGADPGFRNMDTKANRVEPKKPREANAFAAHLVILLKDKVFGGKYYWPALLEDVPSVGKSRIQLAVTNMLNGLAIFQYKDESGSERKIEPRFKLMGLENETVAKDISGGKLSYFVAIKDVAGKPSFDPISGLQVTSQQTKLKPARDRSKKGAIAKLPAESGRSQTVKDYLRNIAAAGKEHGYDRMRVHYTREDGKNRSFTFGTAREDSEDFLIKKVDRIKNLKTKLGQTHPQISDELVQEMIKRLE